MMFLVCSIIVRYTGVWNHPRWKYTNIAGKNLKYWYLSEMMMEREQLDTKQFLKISVNPLPPPMRIKSAFA